LRIKLEDLEIVYINLSEAVNRNQSMVNMLSHCGLRASRVEGILASANQEYDVVADSHLKALNSSSAEKLLILEDDCVPHNYRNEIEVPDDADIVYLGIHGYQHARERISPELWKVSGMIAAHAILYLTQQGKDILIEAQKLTKDKKYAFDVSLAKLQNKVNTYALNSPVWYQKDYPELTKFELDNSEHMTFGMYGGVSRDYEEPIRFDTPSS
jgi:hypothetical protein